MRRERDDRAFAPRMRRAGRLALNVALKNLSDLFLGYGSYDLIGHLAILENEKRWDPSDIEFARDAHVVVDIELDDFHFAGMLASDFLDCGRQHVARTTPIGPEIDHYRLRLASVDDLSLKAGVGH
jgi:hypothetical protein